MTGREYCYHFTGGKTNTELEFLNAMAQLKGLKEPFTF